MNDSIPAKRQPLIDIFLDRNSKINLSAIRDPQGVYEKHILDSLMINETTNSPISIGKTVLDIGTGGGFPLLPLAITHPETTFTGLDGRNKKIKVINAMIETLGLKNCTAIWSRAEDHKTRYDIVTARAVAYADKILQRAVPKTKKKGHILLWKQFTFEEDADIRELCHHYKLKPLWEHQYTLSGDETKRVIYCLQKQ